jgi:hypothetical protein
MVKKDTKIYFILSIIIILIIIGIFWIKGNDNINKEDAICIGENSELYSKLGCPACEKQEKMFGKYYEHLNMIDCSDNFQECADAQIIGTPTWIINEQEYRGIQSIEKLKELTGC